MTTTQVVMSSQQRVWPSRNWYAALCIAALLSFLGKVFIASRTFGATDALLWEANLQQLQEAGPTALYENGTVLRRNGTSYHSEVFNHPPLMVRLLYVGGWLVEQTHIPLRFWLRIICAVADVASTILILKIMSEARLRGSPVALFLVAASPISLLISGFHGNTDPIMMALLLLAIYSAQRGSALVAGVVLGLAAGIKIVPLLFAPVLLLALPRSKRALFATGAIGILFAGSVPLVIDHPALIWSRVFNYTPQTGIWGISRLVAAASTEVQTQTYAHAMKIVTLVVLGAISVLLNILRPHPPLVLQCGLVAFVLISMTPGFGMQYLAWLVPWSCLLSGRQSAIFHSVCGFFLCCYYSRAAHGFPWYLADSAATQIWYGSLIFAGLLCWLVVSSLTVSMFRCAIQARHLTFSSTCSGRRLFRCSEQRDPRKGSVTC